MSFSENLRNIRKDKNLSQEQLAELLGVSRQAISKWEQDNGGYPETEKLIQIAKKLDVSLDTLLLDKPTKDEVKEQLVKNQTLHSQDNKIIIQSFDGQTVSSFYKFITNKVAFATKGEPKCALSGVDSSSFWGDHTVTLGWYKTLEDAQRELNDIYEAIQNGETSYKLKYHANVKIKTFTIEIVDDEK